MSTVFRGGGSGSKYLGNASPNEVLSGKTYHKNTKELLTGSMPNNGAIDQQLPMNGEYTIPAGYHDGSGKVRQQLSTNIVDTSAGDATAAHMLAGKKAIVKGQLITGNIPVRSNTDTGGSYPNARMVSIYPETVHLIPPAGYYDGEVWVKQVIPELKPENIRKGITLPFNLTGTYVGGAKVKRTFSGYFITVPRAQSIVPGYTITLPADVNMSKIAIRIMTSHFLTFTKVSNTIVVKAEYYQTDFEFSYEIIEFENASVQSGYSTYSNGMTTIPISAVNLNKSFIIHSAQCDSSRTLIHIMFKNATSLDIRGWAYPDQNYPWGRLYWNVIESIDI